MSATTSGRRSAFTTRQTLRRSGRRRAATRCLLTRSHRSASLIPTSTAERKPMLKLIIRALAVLVPAALLIAPVTQASSQASLADVRQATAKFHDLHQTTSAGYIRLLPCFDLPGVGGMGQHYVNTGMLDATVNATQPEALVYEVDGNMPKLEARWRSCVDSAASSRSRNVLWACRIMRRAVWRLNHVALSTSGNSCIRPERGGHSTLKVPLSTRSTSRSPGAAHA